MGIKTYFFENGEEEFYTIGEIANKLRMSYSGAYQNIATGQIPGGGKFGGKWLINKKIFDKWLEMQFTSTPSNDNSISPNDA